jgi:hypothetical protein
MAMLECSKKIPPVGNGLLMEIDYYLDNEAVLYALQH